MRHRSRVKSILLGASATRIQRLRQSGHTLPNLLGALLTHLLPCDRRAVRAVQRRLAILCASNPVWQKIETAAKSEGLRGPRRELAACLTRGRKPVPGRHPKSRDVYPVPAAAATGGAFEPAAAERPAIHFTIRSQAIEIEYPILGYLTAKSLYRLIAI